MHPFDRWLFVRTALAITACVAITAAVVVATDEATSTLGLRLARMAALGPLAAGLGVQGVTALAGSRGELRSLAAVGASPWRAAGGAALAGWLATAVAVVVLFLPWTDVASLFPAVHPALAWTFDATGAAHAAGVSVDATGAVALAGAVARRTRFTPDAWSALPCLAPLAAAVPPWAVTPLSAGARAVTVLSAAALAIVALHLVAAERVPAVTAAVAALPLIVPVLDAHRRPARHSAG